MSQRDKVFNLAVQAGMQESDLADAEVLDVFEAFFIAAKREALLEAANSLRIESDSLGWHEEACKKWLRRMVEQLVAERS